MPKKAETLPDSAALEANLQTIVEDRHGERRIFLGIYRALIAILKALEAR